jgi:hypothetical protein
MAINFYVKHKPWRFGFLDVLDSRIFNWVAYKE